MIPPSVLKASCCCSAVAASASAASDDKLAAPEVPGDPREIHGKFTGNPYSGWNKSPFMGKPWKAPSQAGDCLHRIHQNPIWPDSNRRIAFPSAIEVTLQTPITPVAVQQAPAADCHGFPQRSLQLNLFEQYCGDHAISWVHYLTGVLCHVLLCHSCQTLLILNPGFMNNVVVSAVQALPLPVPVLIQYLALEVSWGTPLKIQPGSFIQETQPDLVSQVLTHSSHAPKMMPGNIENQQNTLGGCSRRFQETGTTQFLDLLRKKRWFQASATLLRAFKILRALILVVENLSDSPSLWASLYGLYG